LNHNLAKLLIPYKSLSYSLLKEEQKICVEFANHLRQLTLNGDFPYIWFHIANEFIPSQRINFSFDLKQKHMGKITGLPDYCFISAKDSFFIEFKTAKGKQTEHQKLFEEWCKDNDIRYYIFRSANEGIEFLSTIII
jgi:hypothetical protein